jgi:hypothetical protein
MGLLLSSGLLLGLAVLVGHGKVTEAGPLFEWLTSTLVKPPAAAVLAFVLLVCCTLSVRGLRLKWLVRQPKFVDVPDFLSGSPTSLPVEQLSTMFRNNMTTLRLRPLAQVPGVGPEEDFVDAFESGGTKREGWIGTVIPLLRASLPNAELFGPIPLGR